MIRKPLLEVRQRRSTKLSSLALSPHAVDGSSYCGHRLASIDEYISTLDLRNSSGMNLKNVITLGLSVLEMDSLLPLLFFLPHEWKEANLLDTLVQRHPDIESLLSGAFVEYFTPLTFATLANMSIGLTSDYSQTLTCDMEEDRPDGISDSSTGGLASPNLGARKGFTQTRLPDHRFESSSMFPMLFSGDNFNDPLLPSLPNPFVLSRDMPAIVNKILQVSGSEEGDTADVDVKQTQVGSPINEEAFPGLMWGYHGLTYKQTPREKVVYRVFAAVLNRLGGNCLPPSVRLEILGPSHYYPMGDGTSLNNEVKTENTDKKFTVMLHLTDKERLESVEDLLKCLSKTHRMEFGINAQSTSFSKGLSFEENGETVYIPLAIPYKTGIPNIGYRRKQKSLLSYLPHCYFSMTIQGPVVDASVQAYEGVQGYNGWFPNEYLDIPWQNGDDLICRCTVSPYTQKEGIHAATLCNLNAAVHNLAAHQYTLKRGGYGSLSTCIDSTAIIEMGVRGATTLYPILMSSPAKILLADVAEKLAAASECSKDENGFTKLRSLYLSIPSDIDTQPQDIEVLIFIFIFSPYYSLYTLLSFHC